MILSHRSFTRSGRRYLAIARASSVNGVPAVEVEIAPWTVALADATALEEASDRERQEREDARKRKEAYDVITARIESIKTDTGTVAQAIRDSIQARTAEAAEAARVKEYLDRRGRDLGGVPLYA